MLHDLLGRVTSVFDSVDLSGAFLPRLASLGLAEILQAMSKSLSLYRCCCFIDHENFHWAKAAAQVLHGRGRMHSLLRSGLFGLSSLWRLRAKAIFQWLQYLHEKPQSLKGSLRQIDFPKWYRQFALLYHRHRLNGLFLPVLGGKLRHASWASPVYMKTDRYL
jgi:hypothetical protein